MKYDIGGHIILCGNSPIAQVSNSRWAWQIMEHLTHNNPGQQFTCIYDTGCWTSVDNPKEPEAEKRGG